MVEEEEVDVFEFFVFFSSFLLYIRCAYEMCVCMFKAVGEEPSSSSYGEGRQRRAAFMCKYFGES